MADTKISALASLAGSGVEIGADVLAIVDDSVTTTKKILVSNLLGAAFTTAGDIAQASAAGVAARLGIGTARQVLTVNAGATALAYQNPITLGTLDTTTGGTSIAFGSLPAGLREITMSWVGLSASGTSQWIVQIGDAGGIEATGYEANAGNRVIEVNSTIGFPLLGQAPVAASVYSGSLTLILQDAATFMWVVKSGNNAPVGGTVSHFQGRKALSAVLTQIQITTTNGSDTFDVNGGVNIAYQ